MALGGSPQGPSCPGAVAASQAEDRRPTPDVQRPTTTAKDGGDDDRDRDHNSTDDD